MQAILKSDYSCAPEGHTTFHHKAGEALTGRAAELALADGVAYNPAEETKVTPKLETKRGRK
jgi:hypothetical protein